MPWAGFESSRAMPPEAAPSGPADRFVSDFSATAASELGGVSRLVMEGAANQEVIDRVYATTGRKVDNPAYQPVGPARDQAQQSLSEAWGQAREKDGTLPDFPDIQQRAVELTQERLRTAAARADASVGAGGVGSFAGTMAASMLHPAQLAALPFGGVSSGATWGARVLKSAISNGAIAAATQIPIELEAKAWRERVGLKESSLANIATAALGGTILGGGLHGLGELYRGIRGRTPAPYTTPPGIAAEMQRRGWSPNAAAGLAANAAHEAGGGNATGGINFAAAVNDGGQQSIGAFQWRGPRGEALQAFAKATGRDWREPTTQFDFLDHEVQQFPGLRERMNAAPSPEAAAKLFVHEFERPANVEAQAAARSSTAGKIAQEGQVGETHPDIIDAARSVERAAADADAAHGPREAQTVHGENVMRADALIPDGEELGQPLPFPSRSAPDRVFSPSGRAVDVHHEVVELGSLVPSHTDSFEPNPAYRHDLQPRDRAAGPSQQQVRDMAGSKWAPDRWLPTTDGNAGPPLVGHDNMVESGNGRTLALRRALQDPAKAREYRQALDKAGFPTEGYVHPALIARRLTHMTPAERTQWAQELNRKTKGPKPSAELAGLRAAIERGEVQPHLDPTPDLAAANELRARLSETGQTVHDYLASGNVVPEKTMFWLHALHDDFGLQKPSDPAKVAERLRQYADEAMRFKASDATAKPPTEHVIKPAEERAYNPLFSQQAKMKQAATEAALEPKAADGLAAEARRQIADDLTSGRAGAADQIVNVDGEDVRMADIESRLDELKQQEQAAADIQTSCIDGNPKPPPPEPKSTKFNIKRDARGGGVRPDKSEFSIQRNEATGLAESVTGPGGIEMKVTRNPDTLTAESVTVKTKG